MNSINRFYFLICYLFSHFSPAAWVFLRASNVREIYNPPALPWRSFVLTEGDAWISFDRDDTDGTSQQKSKPVSLKADLSKASVVWADIRPTFFTGTWEMKS